MDYAKVLERFKYQSDDIIMNRISKIDKANFQEGRDIVNEIVLWKLNRSIFIKNNTLELLYSIENLSNPLEVTNNKKVYNLIYQLLSSRGIKLAVASAILHFYYPTIFPIIDQRSYRELTKKEFPNYSSKDKIDRYIKLYLDYIKKCYEYNNIMCPDIPFKSIDKILYQIDKEKGNKVKY